MKNNKLTNTGIRFIFPIITCIILFSSTANAQVFGSIQSVAPQPDGSLIVNGWACDSSKRSPVWVEIFPGALGTKDGRRIAYGGQGINNPPGTIADCMNSISGFSYPISSENVSKHAGKKLWGYVMVNSIKTQMSGSNTITIGQYEEKQEDKEDKQNQEDQEDLSTSHFNLTQLQNLNSSTTGPQVNLDNLIASGRVITAFSGEVIEGMDINGGVIINKDNVTLKNCKVKGLVFIKPGVTGTRIKNCRIDANFWYRGIRINGNDTVIENVEIKNAVSAAILLDVSVHFDTPQSNKVHIKRVNIFNSTDGILSRPENNSYNPTMNLLIEESYIHDSLTSTKINDTLQNLPIDITPTAINQLNKLASAPRSLHVDGIQLAGNKNAIIRNNRISIPSDTSVSNPNAPIFIGPDIFFDDNIIVMDNLLSGGSSSLKVNKKKPIRNLLISNNYTVQGKWIFSPINIDGTTGDLDCVVVKNTRNTTGDDLFPYKNGAYIEDDSCFVGPLSWDGWPADWSVN